MGRFDGQIVIVTGAGQGIGAAIASRFAHEGARVAVADRNPDTAASVAASISAAAGSGGAGSGDDAAVTEHAVWAAARLRQRLSQAEMTSP